MNSKISHLPVMVREVLSYLIGSDDGAYLDLTVGLGGHLAAIGKAVSPTARLYGIDRDTQAIAIAQQKLEQFGGQAMFHAASYLTIDTLVDSWPDRSFDGILLDLGLSSMQLDEPERGFSFRHDTVLDMRFDATEPIATAADLLNSLTEQELQKIFFDYGEERRAKAIAQEIVRERQNEMILTTTRLKDIVSKKVSSQYLNKSLARIFQALRIAVNRELSHLEEVLPKLPPLMNQSGRLVVLTYHSLEDRLVKRFFQKMVKGCVCPPDFAVCVCGQEPAFVLPERKAILPTPVEIEENSRARSAKLRVAEKI